MRRKKAVDFSSMRFDLDSIMMGQTEDEEEKPTIDPEKEFIRAAKLNYEPVCWENAEEAADSIDIDKDYFAFVSGKFVFGEFIEALLFKKRLLPDAVYITTLGMGQENIDSIVNLTTLGAKKVNLIVSNYFVGMERRKLVPYMVQEFTGYPIDVAVLASHCKLCLIERSNGDNIMIAGSANLSSSNNVEQFQIMHDEAVFQAVKTMLDGIMDSFTVLHGASGETIFENNTGNTGKNAYKAVKEAF